MKKAVKTGFSFGITTGIITTLGLMVGMFYGTKSKLVIIGAILTIAVADALADSLGVHISQETTTKDHKNVWIATFTTFIVKFLFTLTFLIPVLLFTLQTAIVISIIYGLTILGILSYKIGREKPWYAVMEHLGIALLVIVATYFVGKGIALFI
jgi:vacuolar iron transporter family protein